MVNAGDDVRVMIIDDHEVVRRGIAEVVERADGLGVVAEAGSVQEAIRRGELVRPDVALVDLRLPDGTGIDIISRMREASPETKCIVLTSFDDDDALAEAQEAGARAYLLKSVRGAEITENIKAVASGRILLDERTVSGGPTTPTRPRTSRRPSAACSTSSATACPTGRSGSVWAWRRRRSRTTSPRSCRRWACSAEPKWPPGWRASALQAGATE